MPSTDSFPLLRTLLQQKALTAEVVLFTKGQETPSSMVAFKKESNIPSQKNNAETNCCSDSEMNCDNNILSDRDSCVKRDTDSSMEIGYNNNNNNNNNKEIKCENESLNGSNHDSSFCNENHQRAKAHDCDRDQNTLDRDSCDKLSFKGKIDYSKDSYSSKEPNTHSSKNRTETDSCDNLEHSNDSFDSENKLSSHPTKKEQNETKSLESSEDSTSQDTRRTRRYSKRKRDSDECCPVCGLTVRLHELEGHFTKEVENLSKIPKNLKKTRLEEKGISTTFVQVKSNRENRLAAKVARYAVKSRNEIQCPVCYLKITGTQEEMNKHVLDCTNEDEELVIVDDDEDSFEEYEFADQTRVRAISFIPGGYRSLQGHSSKHKIAEDDEDVNVDVDDTMTYGKPQYTELDVIHNTTNSIEVEEIQQLRKAVLLDPNIQPQVLESRKWTIAEEDENKEQNESLKSEISVDANVKMENVTYGEDKPVSELSNHVMSSLKEKIKDLEEQNKSVKCLICLEPYTKPVVSTTCWHVHCEECWLMTMGVKKLCPQCNMIVFPSDLRRIYL